MPDISLDQHIKGCLDADCTCEGNLTISKDIEAGHVVRVEGNLTVMGSIKGSEITVNRDCTVTGMVSHETDKGRLVVHGHLRTGSLDKANIECGKTVFVEGSIIRSMVKSKETVNVSGAVEGGEVSAVYGVAADTLGYKEQAAKATQIEAGMNYRLKIMLEEMNLEVDEIDRKAVKIRLGLAALEAKAQTHYSGIPFHEKMLIKNTRVSLETFEKQLSGLHSRKSKLEKKLEKTAHSFIEVKSRILPGTCLCIQHRFVVAAKEYPPGRYTVLKDKICRLDALP